MNSTVENNRGGFGLLGLLGILFVGLKLTGYITWSWWLVTLPFWAGIALFLGIILLGLLIGLCALIAVALVDWWNK